MLRPVLALTAALTLTLALTAIACGDDDDDGGDATPAGTSTSRPSATASPAAGSPTPSNDDCPAEKTLCDVADEVEANINTPSIDPFFEEARPGTFTCPAPGGQGLDPLGVLCQGAAEGEQRQGFPQSRLQSEGTISDEAGTRAAIQLYADEHEDIAAITIGCPLADETPTCDNRFAVTVAAEGSTGRTDLLLFIFERDAGGAHLSALLFGDGELNPEMVSGGISEIGLVFGERGATQFVTIAE